MISADRLAPTRLVLLDPESVERVLDEAFRLLASHGVRVLSKSARQLLEAGGASVDEPMQVVKVPETVARRALSTAPAHFHLFKRDGSPAVAYGGSEVHFAPGSSGVNVLDPASLTHRPAQAADLLRLIQVAEMLPQYEAQSTAVVCSDVPEGVADIYRLYLVLRHSVKPIVTGAFTISTAGPMFDMLAIAAGGSESLARKPLAVFDVCPTPPLTWSEFAAQNLMDLARAGIPAEIVSMPLAGAAAPVTLLGSVVQHAAETISGIVIHQLAQPGAPVVWGGAPAIFDMRQGTTPLGAMETAMIDAAYAQVGRSLDLPTHAYMGASDAKLVDAQAGLESGMTALVGALAGINMIAGPGMLDFLACQSPEKLVIDAEGIAMAQHLLRGVGARPGDETTEMLAAVAFRPDFLKLKVTRQLFHQEQYLPSMVVDRGSLRAWQAGGSSDAFARARARVVALVAEYARPATDPVPDRELEQMMIDLARSAGMDKLPQVDG